MKQTFSNHLKQLRKQKNLSQEQLAAAMGVSTQAVSKWECAQSYPDVESLPALADLLGTTVDALLRDGSCQPAAAAPCDLPGDNILRILQCRGKTVLTTQTYDPTIKILLKNVSGNVNAGDDVRCGSVSGRIVTGGDVIIDGK